MKEEPVINKWYLSEGRRYSNLFVFVCNFIELIELYENDRSPPRRRPSFFSHLGTNNLGSD